MIGAWPIYDFLHNSGSNLIKAWGDGGSQSERVCRRKSDLLAQHGDELPPGLLSDTSIPTIKKIRVNGRVAVRLMLCRGPIDVAAEFTLLMGVVEKDRKLIPENAEAIAEERRLAVKNDGSRRINHVRFN